MKGIPAVTSECLVALYADDLLMNPGVCITYLIQFIKSFSKISGYTINLAKTELVFI